MYGTALSYGKLNPESLAYSITMDGFKRLSGLGNDFGHLRVSVYAGYPSRGSAESKSKTTKTKDHPFINIKTCVIKNTVQPELVIEYSNKPCPYYNKRKLVLAHGMYGFPYIDSEGEYGISNRDKYVYLSDNLGDLKRLQDFLSSDLVFYLFNATRYRMKYLEKYIFMYLPNILMMREEEVTMLQDIAEVPKNKYLNI